jgi:hypothetical protein
MEFSKTRTSNTSFQRDDEIVNDRGGQLNEIER